MTYDKESNCSMGSTPKKPSASFARPEPAKEVPPARTVAVRRQPDMLNPYLPGDPIPRPDAVEPDTDTTWAEWSNLEAAENRRFADTAPASRTIRQSNELGYAPTSPAPLQNLHALPAAPVRRELTVVEAMVEARKNNRVWIPKRMCFREHIEWAASHGCLQQVVSFTQGLPESDWHHMGD